MKLINGRLFMPDGSFHLGELTIDENHRISHICLKGDDAPEQFTEDETEHEIIDAHGQYVIPGLVDVHIHGAMTGDFSDGDVESLKKMAKYLKSQGITSFCPTSMTNSIHSLKKIFQTAQQLPEDEDYASIVGINIEGPFLAPKKKGAQKEEFLSNPDILAMEELMEASKVPIRLVTIAPELPGGLEFIQHFHNKVSISIGHSIASYEEAQLAMEAGANHVTHLYNAMTPWNHREPGIIGAAYDQKEVMVELIGDGIHVHPSVVRSTFAMFGDDRVILISDSMRAAGMEDGDYELGGQHVIKQGRRAILEDGTLAGSVTNLAQQMRNAVAMGIPLESAVKAVTCNPARSIGLEREIGQLAVGNRGDVVLMDEELKLTLLDVM